MRSSLCWFLLLLGGLVCLAPPVEAGEKTGLSGIDRERFSLKDAREWRRNYGLVWRLSWRLPRVTVGDVLKDLNRRTDPIRKVVGRKRVRVGFEWNRGDDWVRYWYPQGVTGTWDAFSDGDYRGRRVALVSWYCKEKKGYGVRVSFCDVTNPRRVRYRHVLLVEPTRRSDGRPDFRPVKIHAGGIVWYGPYLYVADTSHGFRVFDLRFLMRVATDRRRIGYDARSGRYHAFKYKYILPQVNRYRLTKRSRRVKFSFVSLDRSGPTPALVSGEYRSSSSSGRLLRWRLGTRHHGLLMRQNGVHPQAAWTGGQTRMQGALQVDGRTLLSCSSRNWSFWPFIRNDGRLYETGVCQPPESHRWVYGPEDLSYDPKKKLLWSASEHPGTRTVFAIRLPD